MNIDSFKKIVDKLNEGGNAWGNEILYKMAADSDLKNQDQLSGAMWLIGRSYAASPQRRSYKKKSWIVRPDNDGRDQFFSSIAAGILADSNCTNLQNPLKEITFTHFDRDKEALVDSIRLVLRFNNALSRAILKFDRVNDESISCNNHISFCSKFLHFYHPRSVFIIDNFAQHGGNLLFSEKSNTYICDPDNEKSYDPLQDNQDFFDSTLCDTFRKTAVAEISKTLKRELADCSDTVYIEHCARSYLFGCWLKERNIRPAEQASIPRLTDTVFLNIKAPLPEAKYNGTEPKNERAALQQLYAFYKEKGVDVR